MQGATWGDAIYVHLLLRSMSHFAAANHAYIAAVPQSSAPSRACVASPLPPAVLCSLDVSVAKAPVATAEDPTQVQGGTLPDGPMRRVMHVQSLSEWAPASIGPYSQATVWGGLLHIAGQIPLDPASMQVRCLPPSPSSRGILLFGECSPHSALCNTQHVLARAVHAVSVHAI